MSADSVLPHRHSRSLEAPGPDVVALRAVDIFDIASQLESQGFGDAAARRLGHRDVFAYSMSLQREHRSAADQTDRAERTGGPDGAAGTVAIRPPPRRSSRFRGADPSADVIASIARVALLLAGIVICALTMPLALLSSRTENLLVVAGAASWAASHVLGAAIWYDRDRAASSHRSAWPVVAALVVTGVIATSFVTGGALPLVWGLWAVGIAIGLPLSSPWAQLLVVGPLVGLCLLARVLLGPEAGVAFAIVATLIVLVCAALITSRSGLLRRPVSIGITAGLIATSLIQCGGQIVTLLVLLAWLPHQVGVAVAFGAVAGAAAADLSLTVAITSARTHVSRRTDPVRARRRLRYVGWIAAVVPSLVAATLAYSLAPHDDAPAAAAAASIVAALGVLITLALRVDRSSLGAVVAAIVALVTTVLLILDQHLIDPGSATTVEALLLIGAAMLSLSQVLVDPSIW